MLVLQKILLLAGVIVAAQAQATSRDITLQHWLDKELVPFVGQQLSAHPRFRGESIRFVVFEGNAPVARSNALALDIRDRLLTASAMLPGVRIALQPDAANSGLVMSAGIDCTLGEVDYLVGVELRQYKSGQLGVELKAIDMEDQSVVAGFSKSWRGDIGSRQYRELNREKTDATFRGERDAPFEKVESDLLAAHLAYQLGCRILRQTDAEFVLKQPSRDPDAADATLELVRNNLANYNAVRFSTSAGEGNASIEGRAHRVADDLYQYWVTVEPASADVPAVSASAYVRLPEPFRLAAPAKLAGDEALRSQSSFLQTFELVDLTAQGKCRSFEKCFGLQVAANDDAVVFFLNYQVGDGLVSLADASCRSSASARVVKSEQQRIFALPPNALLSATWSVGKSWDVEPEIDTYYAVAVRESRAARQLSRHIASLPTRCTAAPRYGLEGAQLRHWMRRFGAIVDEWSPAIDWQSIRVKNVY